ncbi:hypothetical protein D3C81_2139770 [compost metagenome]
MPGQCSQRTRRHLIIGIEEDQVLPPSLLDPAITHRRQTAIGFAQRPKASGMLGLELFQDLRRRVGGTVIDHQQFSPGIT